MGHFLSAAKLLLLDLASTLVFLATFFVTDNLSLSVGLGVAFGLGQIALHRVRRKPIESMDWLSLALVVCTGAAALITDDPRVVLLKPSVFYAVTGVFMLRAGWMNRYLPPLARRVVPDVASTVGLVWAGLMFVSAALNAFVALRWSITTWATVMPAFGLISKAFVFVGGFAAIRLQARRRLGAMAPDDRAALLAAIRAVQPAPAEAL